MILHVTPSLDSEGRWYLQVAASYFTVPSPVWFSVQPSHYSTRRPPLRAFGHALSGPILFGGSAIAACKPRSRAGWPRYCAGPRPAAC
jgi:hypothetical protein